MDEVAATVLSAATEWRQARVALFAEINASTTPYPSLGRLGNAEYRLMTAVAEYQRKFDAEPE